jgi:hypothetical protein
VSRAPSENARRGAAGLLQLQRDGRVDVEWRDEILRATGVPLGSWARTVAALKRLGVILRVEKRPQGHGEASAYVLNLERCGQVSAGWAPSDPPDRSEARPEPSHGSPESSEDTRAEPTRVETRASGSKTKRQHREKEDNNNNRAEPSPEPSRAEVREPGDPVATALRYLADAFVLLAVRLGGPLQPGATPVASPVPATPALTPHSAPADLSPVAPPLCDCGPMKARPGMDGEAFYGCARGPERVGGCGAQTIGVAVWEASQRFKARAAAVSEVKAEAKAEKQEAAREERMRGRERPADLSTLGPEHLKRIKAERKRDPRKEPVAGDVVEAGGTARKVASVSEGRVTWDVLGMQGERHSASLEQWVRWGKGAAVRTRGVPPVADAVASLLEGALAAQRQADATPEVQPTT